MQNVFRLAAPALAAIFMSAASVAADRAFVTVNGVAIKQDVADIFIAQAVATGQPDDAQLQQNVREELVRRELMYQAATRAGVDKRPDVAAQVDAATRHWMAQADAARHAIVARAYAEDYLKQHPVTDAQLRKTYDAYRARGGNTEYKLRHIVVATDAEARAVIARLNKGEKFADLASLSIDASTRGSGGDLGWAGPARFAKPFGDALAGIKKGRYSAAPVRTEFGYHVIAVEDTRPLKVPSFNELKPMLQKEAEAGVIDAMLAQQRAAATIR